MSTQSLSPVTAACCLIGDEILNGKTRDSNSHFLAKYLFDCGIDLKRVEIVGDDYGAIAESVTRLSEQHDIVFTSGGIGPTHDDISYEAIARAYSLPLVLDPKTCEEMERTMSARSKDWTLTEARKRMATFPYPAQILRTSPEELWVPVVVVNGNIHILPGIPRLFERLLTLLRPRFEQMVKDKGALGRYYRVQVATSLTEGDIANCLSTLQQQMNEHNIKIGSYPRWSGNKEGARVVVSVVGRDEKMVEETGKLLVREINGWIYKPTTHTEKV
ncbi:MoaB/Mog domain-containing protein [Dichotomocladium elegans]|nr:MoaB/Mog domain-containing protein [Dichotomocladium elegans]